MKHRSQKRRSLDEATEGLAPIIRQEIWQRLRDLRNSGLTVIVIDKEVDTLTEFANRHFIVEKGEVVWTGDSVALQASPEIHATYLSV